MRRFAPDISIIVLLFLLPLVMFWPQTVGGRTLLPTENLYQYAPYATYREVVQAPAVPHNHLLSDLVLQNMQWKLFTRQNLSEGEIPLWNPYQFSGIPFIAAGQQSTFYPFSLLYYVLPITAAYGWFTVVQLWLAGVFMYLFLRGLDIGRFGGTVAGVTYQLSAFFVINAVFPMIIGAAVWLPLLLLMIEFTIRQRPLLGRPASLPWVAIGAVALGCNIFAGHPEITYYTLLIMAYYAAARLFILWRRESLVRPQIRRGLWLVAMVALGIGLGAAQFLPLFEFANMNWRSERGDIDTVLSYAHPPRDMVQFALPNFYGSPAHHSYFDWFTLQTVPVTVNSQGEAITHTEWGMKNYVEAALYVGILPLALAAYALLHAWTQRREDGRTGSRLPTVISFTLLALAGLTFMFGLPTYPLIYLLPGINQLNTPFRWIFAVTMCVAVLAGYGAHTLIGQPTKLVRRWGLLLMMAGGLVLAGLLLSRVFYMQIEPLIERVLTSMATPDGRTAASRFADARMFYSYQFTHGLVFGLMTLAAGVVFWWSERQHSQSTRSIPLLQVAVVGLVAVDLMIASWGFNPASDPALLDFTPPAIEWLQQQPGHWRYTTLQDPSEPPLFNANMTWRYGLRDVRGYESIIPRQYVDFMRQLAPQPQLDFNRIAPLYTDYAPLGIDFDYRTALDDHAFDLLAVRFVVSHKSADLDAPGWSLAYEDEAVRIWQTDNPYPYAFTIPSNPDWLTAAHSFAIEGAATILADSGREKHLHVQVDGPSELLISENYIPGWRAYAQTDADGTLVEEPLTIQASGSGLQQVHLPTAGDWTIRLVYSPQSFQLGVFGSFISGILIAFMIGVWLWRLYVAPQGGEATSAARIARNSLAPILLNLFNRAIDFALAAVVLRILGPEDAGVYQYAIVIFVWFDIFTNFGLNTLLTREVARDRSRAGHYFLNTSVLRIVLVVIGVLPLVGFLGGRQSLVQPPLNQEALLALGLLYLGLLPNSLSTGMTALFYAFEKAEYPSAVSTVATIIKAVFNVAALALGFGIVGLAATSILTNFVTLAILLYGGRGLLRGHAGQAEPRQRFDRGLLRSMVGESWPLMINHFMATIFFQIDIVLLESMRGSRIVGLYSVAYKWVAAINVIPAFFTMAMLPVMSRQAYEDRDALKRTYMLAIKLLMSIALPTAILFTFFANDLTRILGGAEYLPDGAIATQLMIWSIPFGWINSLTQYVLIALDLQRRITRAFLLAVIFNIVTNLIFIPQYGYQAAAITTILSEIMLLLPFGVLLTRALGRINWIDMIWRQAAAALVMLAVMLISQQIHVALVLITGITGYLLALLLLRPLSREEIERLIPLLPGRLRPISVRLFSH